MARNRARLANARAEIATGAISGAVATFANIDPAIVDCMAAMKEVLGDRVGLALDRGPGWCLQTPYALPVL